MDLCIVKRDYVKAKEFWYRLLLHRLQPFFDMCGVSEIGERPNWMQLIKEGLQMRGRKVGPPRRPLLPLEEDERQRLKRVLTYLGLIG